MDVERIASLVVGDRVAINGHAVTRVGLCGDSAYSVDGEVMSLELAELYAVTPVRRAEQIPSSAPKPALRARSRQRHRATPLIADPALLVEVKDAVTQRKLFRFAHRSFAGGEAVTITAAGEATTKQDMARALTEITRSGLHAEWAAGGEGLVVAWTKGALAPEPKTTKGGKAA